MDFEQAAKNLNKQWGKIMGKPSLMSRVSQKLESIFAMVVMTCVTAIAVVGTIKIIIWMLN